MSNLTDAASRPGQRAGTGDDRALFLTEFGGMVIQARDAVFDYDMLHWVKNITQGKADTFPIIGRAPDAAEHVPGSEIVGGTVIHDDVEISLDKMIYSSVFIPEIDELMNHYELRGPYAHQLGQALGSIEAKRIAIMHILASRKFYVGGTPTGVPDGQPNPTYFYHANMATSQSQLESAAWGAKQYLMENDMSGELAIMKLRPQQYLLVARYFGLVSDAGLSAAETQFKAEAGGGDRQSGTVKGLMVGFDVKPTNHIPSTNITTGLTKYQGNFTTTVGHISSRMAVGTLRRRGMRLVIADKPERLGTLMIASQFNGHGILRPECSIELATAVRS